MKQLSNCACFLFVLQMTSYIEIHFCIVEYHNNITSLNDISFVNILLTTSYDIKINLCYLNYNVIKNHNIRYDGNIVLSLCMM